ncbi:lytic transglycosylase domain-containing protein [Microvirga lenta]|uniref:lytic transglycosylase domain-containing protein n=1 Tax=Microvirga lenta TaxID=2881337 RepID=UPI001CFD62EE|nr:lytic transglycosylase domain-containing protein [Microvirga lenta]MCB5174245.1 lytic transglycosylase domain-containing protein [Microvirga lenta]
MRFRLALCSLVFSWASALGAPSTETVEQALCRLIDNAAAARQIPTDFLTKLIWQESSFRTGAISPAGAQGVAQFMPGTARERGLADPFDPEQAIPEAAKFIHELTDRFGNLGLAAAAYNGGPARVASWLSGRGGLPAETRNYVFRITGRSAEDWAADLKEELNLQTDDADAANPQKCMQVVALLRQPGRGAPEEAPFAPWGVQLAGNFSKSRALASFARARQAYAAVLGEIRPMIIGTRLRHRGTRTFYRVRAPATSRNEANQLCDKIRKAGGSCVVLPS